MNHEEPGHKLDTEVKITVPVLVDSGSVMEMCDIYGFILFSVSWFSFFV